MSCSLRYDLTKVWLGLFLSTASHVHNADPAKSIRQNHPAFSASQRMEGVVDSIPTFTLVGKSVCKSLALFVLGPIR